MGAMGIGVSVDGSGGGSVGDVWGTKMYCWRGLIARVWSCRS